MVYLSWNWVWFLELLFSFMTHENCWADILYGLCIAEFCGYKWWAEKYLIYFSSPGWIRAHPQMGCGDVSTTSFATLEPCHRQSKCHVISHASTMSSATLAPRHLPCGCCVTWQFNQWCLFFVIDNGPGLGWMGLGLFYDVLKTAWIELIYDDFD